jgi:sulfoxide reductase heme-binding subunit YedZ
MLDCHLLARIQKHVFKIKIAVLFASLLPFLILLFEFYHDSLGIDPLDRLTRLTGKSALILLLLSLTITPLRHFLVRFMIRVKANYGKRLSDWNWIIKTRRTLGVMSFFYVLLHFIIYYWLDQGTSLLNISYDVKERNFIAFGFAAFILLIPLALTSTNSMMRLLGKKWRRLHRTVYLVAILAITHFWMLSKLGVYDYAPYFLVVLYLLGWRIWYYLLGPKGKVLDDGMEAIDREQVNRIIKNLDILAVKQFGVDEGKTITAMLFHLFANEEHFSESILNRRDDVVEELNLGSKSLVRRLKVARNNANKKLSIKSIVGVQALHRIDFLELVYKFDALLKHGIMSDQIGDKDEVDKVWNEIFALLMPIPQM